MDFKVCQARKEYFVSTPLENCCKASRSSEYNTGLIANPITHGAVVRCTAILVVFPPFHASIAWLAPLHAPALVLAAQQLDEGWRAHLCERPRKKDVALGVRRPRRLDAAGLATRCAGRSSPLQLPRRGPAAEPGISAPR